MAGELLYAETQGDQNKLWMGDVSILYEFRSIVSLCWESAFRLV